MDTKKHGVDELFRKGLADLEISPTASGKSRFLKKAKQELRKRSISTFWMPGLAIILGIGILGGAYLFIKNMTKDQDQKNKVEATISQMNSGKSIFGLETKTPEKPIHLQNTPGISQLKPQSPVAFRNKAIQNSNDNYIPLAATSTKTLSKTDQGTISLISFTPLTSLSKDTGKSLSTIITSQQPENQNVFLPEKKAGDSIPVEDSSKVHEKSLVLSDTTANPGIPPAMKGHKHSNSASLKDKIWNIRAGIYYMPEWIFNSLDRNKYVDNFGAEGIFRFGPYSIRTGIGLSITKAYNEMVVETNPYLGSYNKLDSMTYHWDSRHYYLLKTVYTTTQNVYDTVLHYKYYTREMEYTYLQVPLILGDDFLETKWFTLGVRVGPVMSVLLHTQVLTSAYDAGKDKIIMINDISPDRIHLNWQAMAGMNAAFRLSHRFILELEPNIRYYFDSVNEKLSPTDKPWSVGLQTSFLVNF